MIQEKIESCILNGLVHIGRLEKKNRNRNRRKRGSMNQIWSDRIQGVMTLYLSRLLRFDDHFSEQYRKAFQLDEQKKLKLLEIGCGPGALAASLHRWYPKAQITAIDQDSRFISFAKSKVEGVKFIEGDACQLPFPDNSFDVTISNTVQEHIDPTAFWGEQMRVLKPNGICLCLSARKGITCLAPCLEMTASEQDFWERIPSPQEELKELGIGRYQCSEAELPQIMEQFGFSDLTTNYVLIDLTPDDSKFPSQLAETMIEAMRQRDLEAIQSTASGQAEKAIAAVQEKYNERVRLYQKGIKQWDTSISLLMIVRGKKPLKATH